MDNGVASCLVGVVANSDVALRPARSNDERFLRDLYASTRIDELGQIPWTAEEKSAFCDFQFDMHGANLRSAHATARDDIVVVAGRDVGRLIVDQREVPWVLVDVAIVPEARGHGIATTVIGSLLEQARIADVPVVLHVLTNSAARQLYERLGFLLSAPGEVRCEMMWRPSSQLETTTTESRLT